MKVNVAQLCLTLCDPTTGVDSFSLLQGIFPTQELNPGLPHCRQILYHKACPQEECKKNGRKSFDDMDLCEVMSLLFNMPSRLVIAFLPRSKCLLILWLQSLSTAILEAKKIKSVTVSTFFPSICPEVMGPDT